MREISVVADPGRDRAAHPAALRFRLCTRADLETCTALLPAGFRAGIAIRSRLIVLWERLLKAEARVFTVIEDLERAHPDNIEAFGLSVFVNDDFVETYCAAPRPHLAAHVYEQMLAGNDPVLTSQELLDANSTTGVNMVGMPFGLRNHDLSDPHTAQVLSVASAAFYFFHSGYRVKCMVHEVYGTQAASYMEAGGFRRVRDFQRENPAAFAHVPPAHYPHLFMLRPEWSEPGAVNQLSMLLTSPSPRFYFSATERRLLERALLNESDQQIGAALGISLDSVKKTWRSIYDRVSRRAPQIIPANDAGSMGSRGQEKRRHLLDYLRTHLEELRPAKPPPTLRKG
jgi:DNA-binding CsgD family transcriptional regulator